MLPLLLATLITPNKRMGVGHTWIKIQILTFYIVAIGVMKGLDLYIRRNSPPKYAYEDPPSSLVIALLLFTELRYESFKPNFIGRASVPSTTMTANGTTNGTTAKGKRTGRSNYELNFSEPVNLLLHSLLFVALQTLFLQTNPTVIAVQILLAIYILWSTLQLILRYRTSPPLFGPIYKATSLGTFWSDIWHGAFTSPCRSLAYDPVSDSLRKFGFPLNLARGAGVIASFFLMAMFHVYGLWPLLPGPALLRIGAFFVLNGVGTVVEEAIWGKRVHWVKTVLAWTYELAVASWTAEGLNIPEGLVGIDLTALC